jgi:hypothetical protein
MRHSHAIRGSRGSAIEFREFVELGIPRVAVEGGEFGQQLRERWRPCHQNGRSRARRAQTATRSSMVRFQSASAAEIRGKLLMRKAR